jgi:hypothetical protein
MSSAVKSRVQRTPRTGSKVRERVIYIRSGQKSTGKNQMGNTKVVSTRRITLDMGEVDSYRNNSSSVRRGINF